MLRCNKLAPLARAISASGVRKMSSNPFADYGSKAFVGHVADKYLRAHGESAEILNDPHWPAKKADKVAAAILDWGKDEGATVFTHWFQPLGASGVRHGMTGQVHNQMFTFGKDGQPNWKFTGKDLLRGETDGSSYPSGGLRATHTAGGYNVVDASSHIFMRGDTIFIPCAFISWTGHALDEKTPLLRSQEAMSAQGKRLAKLLGWNIPGLVGNIGLEQEFFLIPADAYARRLDLQMTGRTIMGKDAPRGQEMCDHYMAALNPHAHECMTKIQEECYKIGIPLRTRHREVAPNQYEFAPMFGNATSQIDQNLMVMQISEEVSKQYNLVCLMQEKPFNNVNGSGKHNNWSLGTVDGSCNLLNAKQVTEMSGNADMFPILISAIVSAVHKHGDLMRMSISSPGNDFRLGACEAPPAILSTYLGDDLTNYLTKWKSGNEGPYVPAVKILEPGVSTIAPFEVPSEDRNRTSPFPYGGHRFEFRAVGSSQNVSMVNTVLNSMTADSFKEFADAIEGGAKPKDVAVKALEKAWNVIFNGNGYDPSWPEEAGKRGIWRIDSAVDAMNHISSEKNVKMFTELKVMSKAELLARKDVMFAHYTGSVEMEALCMIDMIRQQIIPACKEAGMDVSKLAAGASKVAEKLAGVHHEEDAYKKAGLARQLRLETMIEVRAVCDAAEAECPAGLWPLATYKELLFLDANQDAHGNTL